MPKSNGPSKGSCRSGAPGRPRRPRLSRPRVVASMFTTAGLIRSTTSAKLTSDVDTAPPAGRNAGRAGAFFTVPVRTEAGVKPPAKMAPTRKATTAVSARVTKVKRRMSLLSHYKSAKRVLIQRFDAELAGLLEFAPRVAAGDQVVGLLAERGGHARAEPLQRGFGLLARHGRQRSREHERLAGERTLVFGRFRHRLRSLTRHVHTGVGQPSDELAVARLIGKQANRRGDHGADVGHRLQLLDRRVEHGLHRSQVPRERRARLFADVADAERVDQTGQVVPLAPLDLFDDVAADLSELAGHRALGA